MPLWLIRVPAQREELALKGILAPRLPKLPDLAGLGNRGEIDAVLRAAHPNSLPDDRTRLSYAAWAFYNRMKEGDLVIMPQGPVCAIGRIAGPYAHRRGQPTRSVTWLRTDMPESTFEPLLRSLLQTPLALAKLGEKADEERLLQAIGITPLHI